MTEHDEPILSRLNEPQREAVLRIDGPLLVLAGAGSGKTRVLTHRIAWMIRSGIPPSAILGVTFTNKAAREMRGRVVRLTGRGDVGLSTFHSFSANFLRREFPAVGRPGTFTIYDEGDSLVVVRAVLDELGLDEEHHKPAALRARISHWKNAAVSPAEAMRRAAGTIDADQAEAYAAYDRILEDANACDFDDLLVKTVAILEQEEEIRRRSTERITHLLVDEFQDTNAIQYRLVRLLTGDAGNLCITGDQDQSIYSWRGAEIENFDRFLRDYPQAPVVRLEQNYRSTGFILGAASTLVAKNRHRIPKRLWTAEGDGEPVRVVGFHDDWEEALAVASEVKNALREGEDPAEIAVLYRTNSLSPPVERALAQSRIPYRIVGGLEFFARSEVKDVLAWLRFLVNPADGVSFARLLDAPPRKIGDSTRELLVEIAGADRRPLGEVVRDRTTIERLPSRARKPVEALARLLLDLDRLVQDRERGLKALVTNLLQESGFEDHWLKKASKDGSLDPWQNLGQFVNLAEEFDRRAAPGTAGDLAAFLGEIALLTDLERDDEEGEVTPISLMTLHAAKGLEFERVFLIGVDRTILPHVMVQFDRERNRNHEGEEEERRLLHVGMTRARRHLVMTWAATRQRFGTPTATGPSPFLGEIGTEGILEFGGRDSGPRRSPANAPRQGGDSYIVPEDADGPPGPRRARAAAAGGDDFADFEDLDEDHPYARLRQGSRVVHADFGTGEVLALRGRGLGLDRKIVVRFPGLGDRTLVLRHSRLSVLDDD